MNDYIDANELFTLKAQADAADIANKRIYVRELMRKQFSDHLIDIVKSPKNAGYFYFPIKTNDFNNKYLLSNEFLRENEKFFQDYLNNEFKSSNYFIELQFRSLSNHCYIGYYKPINNNVYKSQKSFWSFLFRRT